MLEVLQSGPPRPQACTIPDVTSDHQIGYLSPCRCYPYQRIGKQRRSVLETMQKDLDWPMPDQVRRSGLLRTWRYVCRQLNRIDELQST
jgi:hypothetical protein